MNASICDIISAPSMEPRSTGGSLLIVDDQCAVREFERRVLEGGGYQCSMAAGPTEAREILKEQSFDGAVVDLNMPDESGLALASAIRCDHPEMAVLMVTGVGDPNVANQALDAGADGYLVKPFEANQLLIDVAGVLRRRKSASEVLYQRDQLEQLVARRTTELQELMQKLSRTSSDAQTTQEETILLLARAGESRCDRDGQHIQRMSQYSALIARKLGWDERQCELIRLASVLHDIGKIGVPDNILLKQGPLTVNEFAIMKDHVELGRRILLRMNAEPLQMAATIAWTHHEKYDGSGYCRRLAGETIPLEGRITAIADVFDALTTNKVYRPAHALDKAMAIMRRERGKHFDPQLVDLFLESIDDITTIMAQHPDSPEHNG